MVRVLACAPAVAEIVAGLGTNCDAYCGTARPTVMAFEAADDGPGAANAVGQAVAAPTHVPAAVAVAFVKDGKRTHCAEIVTTGLPAPINGKLAPGRRAT
jgi:hypothetical protein